VPSKKKKKKKKKNPPEFEILTEIMAVSQMKPLKAQMS
jgi:hypothetical protein